MSKGDKILWGILVVLSLVIFAIIMIILNTPNKKYDYEHAYVEVGNTMVNYDIEYYYFEDEMVVIITSDGRTIKTSKDNITLYKLGE